MGGRRNRTTINVFFTAKGPASKIKKKQVSQKQEGISQEPENPRQYCNIQRYFTFPWKKLKVVSHSLTSQCLRQETKNIVQYILKRKNRISKSRNVLKKDVEKKSCVSTTSLLFSQAPLGSFWINFSDNVYIRLEIQLDEMSSADHQESSANREAPLGKI